MFLGHAHADFNLFIAAVNTHGVKQDPPCHQLHHCPNRGHIGPIATCLLNIDVNLPINTGEGAGIFDLGQGLCFIKERTHIRRGCQQIFPIVAL